MYQNVIILLLKIIPFDLQPLVIKSVQKIKNSFYLINSLKYTIVDQIVAVDSFVAFKKLMCKRNAELNT